MLFPGEFGPQRLARDLGLRRRPGCDQRSCHQCRSGDDGERGQGLPQTGEGEPDGRVEVLHLLWVSGVPFVGRIMRDGVFVVTVRVFVPLTPLA